MVSYKCVKCGIGSDAVFHIGGDEFECFECQTKSDFESQAPMKLNVTSSLIYSYSKICGEGDWYFDVDCALYKIYELQDCYHGETCEVSRVIRYPDLVDVSDPDFIERLNATQRENELKRDLKFRLRKRFSFDGMTENLTHFLNKYGVY